MNPSFVFSTQHLIILIFVAIFLFSLPKLTKNLLPYSYLIEKIICISFIFEIILEQICLISLRSYNVLYSLPIGITRITTYICIAILLLKKYHLFNIFFSWSIVCSIGDLIFFKDIPVDFPHILYFFYITSRLLLLYSLVYLVGIRKFKINSNCIIDNIKACSLYFSFTFLLNTFTNANYDYTFSNNNIYSMLLFVIASSLIYVPSLINDKDNLSLNFKRKNKL
ncbi:YwaF family protein [Paraclostridium tenue]|uniref:YwaF family protein n=1 Tax=Paeniclostridium hominis TaxID=2764329 RepID=A0ABR7JZW6_9FIRM|nr:YwaF family protein [Paeniclostridium hominis]MBC8632163.1 YwaF family protein [[Eubacterium] tenue]